MSEPARRPAPDAKTLVVWDYRSCPIPPGQEAVIVDRIRNSVRTLGSNGPVLMKLYGSSTLISDELKQVLEATGVIVTLVPDGPAESNIMILDVYAWARENPPPSNVMFVTGNDDFVDVMRYLKSRGHIVPLIYPRGH